MYIAIIEDNIQELKNLTDCLHNYFMKKEMDYHIESYTNSTQLIHRIDRFDLIFLDIQLPNDKNGVEIGISLRKKNKDVKLIFVTNYSEYLIEGYKAHADRYFIKPITQEQFDIEIDNVIEDYLTRFAGFFDKKICHEKIYYHDILYIEFSERKTLLHFITGKIMITPYSLKYWTDKLKSFSFSQPYKSIIVNLNQISGFYKNDIIMLNNETIPISKHFKKSFEKDYLHNIHKRI